MDLIFWIIVAVIISSINKKKKASGDVPAGDFSDPSSLPTDLDSLKREIRRRIQERSGAGSAPAAPQNRETFQGPLTQAAQQKKAQPARPAEPMYDSAVEPEDEGAYADKSEDIPAALLAAQERLKATQVALTESRMKHKETMAETTQRHFVSRQDDIYKTGQRTKAFDFGLLLRTRSGQRAAFIASEVLNKPRALRPL